MTLAAEILAVGAAVAASLGALARTSTHRPIQMLGLPFLLAGWLGLLGAILPDPMRDAWPLVVLVCAILLVLAWQLSGRLIGREQWLLAIGAAVLTLRIPVPTGDDTAMLLGPLYLVIGIGALVLLRSELDRVRSSDGRVPDRGGSTRLLDIGAAVIPVLAAISMLWSSDRQASILILACFLVPFSLLYSLIRAWVSSGVSIRPAAIALIASATLAAVVGIVQAITGQVWWNPKVIEANRFRADFRTNSLFWDPNIYGRALVVAALAIVAWLLVTRVTRRSMIGWLALLTLLVGALWLTYSQSSWVALAAALIALAVLTLPATARRMTIVGLAGVLVVAVPIGIDTLSGEDASGRTYVVRTGLALAAERPLLGYGVGTFEHAARDRAHAQGDRTPRLVASHTTPVTVLAELGVVGGFAWLLLVMSALVAIMARWRRSSAPRDALVAGWPISPVVWASGAFVAILAHSFLYAGFFEDAAMWAALALIASLPLVDGAGRAVSQR